MGAVGEAIQRLIEIACLAAGADGNQREQPRIARRLGPLAGCEEPAELPERVVQKLRPAVPVVDQALDGIEPGAVSAVLSGVGASCLA